MEEVEFNDLQTQIKDLNLDKCPQEVQDQFYDFLNNVPYIRSCVSKDRKRACDLERDEEGKIIVNITEPHILEDMDYFRPTALHYISTGRFTDLKPNGNPNSEYGKWAREEKRRCFNGYIRPSDGEWITGDYYFFLNYFPILKSTESKTKVKHNNSVKRSVLSRKRRTNRVSNFPDVWDGHYYKFHYIEQARNSGHHGSELSSRGKGKSYTGASLLAKRFELGESYEVQREVQCIVTAYEKKYLSGGNQILDMFKKEIDFLAMHTEWPSKKLVNSLRDLQWRMGYKDLDTDADKGTLNSVIGITSKDDESKLRGTRGVLYLIEEMGTFPRLLGLYSTMRPSVEDGDDVFGLIYMYGTAGDESSDFAAAQEITYNPKGYNMYALPNVFDKEGQGKQLFVFFFPAYLDRAGCYDHNGNSDVTKALLEILLNRYTTKYNTSDGNAIVKAMAELPIVPQEVVAKTTTNIFPTPELTNRVNQLDNDSSSFDDVYVGDLVIQGDDVKFVPSGDIPIRDYPLKDNKNPGALEIYRMPVKDSSGKVMSGRYIMGHDPVDDDSSETMSLTSTFVLDLFTDEIVAEYTGRKALADENFEVVRKLCIFFNARCLYESNKKGIFAYFSQMHSLYYLADTPEYLKDKDIIKTIGEGNKSKGVNATAAVNHYADKLIREWFLKPVPMIKRVKSTNDNGKEVEEDVEVTEFNLYRCKCRALMKEAIGYNSVGNFDRIRALGMLMLYREEFMILYGGDVKGNIKTPNDEEDYNKDPFFNNLFSSLPKSQFPDD